jgi:hypothetical protein
MRHDSAMTGDYQRWNGDALVCGDCGLMIPAGRPELVIDPRTPGPREQHEDWHARFSALERSSAP